MRLSDGNYLYLYNSARLGYPSPMPSYSEQYTVGYLILDKNDPTQILQRSEQPILIPDMAWEIGMLRTDSCMPSRYQLNIHHYLDA